MKKGVIFALLVVFLMFVFNTTALAYFRVWGFMGGRITDIPATKIKELESNGYTCPHGTSISIRLIGSPRGTPTSYFVASPVPMTRTTLSVGQLILGIYGGHTLMTCTRPTTEEKDGVRVMESETVSLDTLNRYGTSR